MIESSALYNNYQIQFTSQLFDCSASFLPPRLVHVSQVGLTPPVPPGGHVSWAWPVRAWNSSGHSKWMRDACQIQSASMKSNETVHATLGKGHELILWSHWQPYCNRGITWQWSLMKDSRDKSLDWDVMTSVEHWSCYSWSWNRILYTLNYMKQWTPFC